MTDCELLFSIAGAVTCELAGTAIAGDSGQREAISRGYLANTATQ